MMEVITFERKVLKKNDEVAAENRAMFRRSGLFVVNLLSSPGSGKTTLLEASIRAAKGRLRIGVVEGDVQTDFDAQRIVATGAPAVQIVTNGACHLEAKLVQDALAGLDLEGLDVLVIENVGNLVCPASFDLGEAKKVVIASTTEGTDKPAKYPKMFRVADACVINKMDLLKHVDFDVERFKSYAREINPELEFIETSARTGDGMAGWLDWLSRHRGG
jgi:hydrogenase nickel incorporation protein HypB